ncbi:hypothetical protein LZ30DRAFT_134945 [Colletotrichum cereale]|nr:hypothetical protein LZ30DRAFT_134945 [Colletotrichum cereale]
MRYGRVDSSDMAENLHDASSLSLPRLNSTIALYSLLQAVQHNESDQHCILSSTLMIRPCLLSCSAREDFLYWASAFSLLLSSSFLPALLPCLIHGEERYIYQKNHARLRFSLTWSDFLWLIKREDTYGTTVGGSHAGCPIIRHEVHVHSEASSFIDMRGREGSSVS